LKESGHQKTQENYKLYTFVNNPQFKTVEGVLESSTSHEEILFEKMEKNQDLRQHISDSQEVYSVYQSQSVSKVGTGHRLDFDPKVHLRAKSDLGLKHLYYEMEQSLVLGSEHRDFFYWIDLNVSHSTQKTPPKPREESVLLKDFKREVLQGEEDPEYQGFSRERFTERENHLAHLMKEEEYRDGAITLRNESFPYIRIRRKQFAKSSEEMQSERKKIFPMMFRMIKKKYRVSNFLYLKFITE
jgi:hypothetical protein